MKQHGLLEQGWRFSFDQAIRRFGCCYWDRKKVTLSAPLTLLNHETDVRATLLHEIAHAVCGRKEGHGPTWRATAIRIGDDGERCYRPARVKVPPPGFIGECPNRCGTKVLRTWRPSEFCKPCYYKANAAGRGQGTPGFTWTPFLLVWRRNPEAVVVPREAMAARDRGTR